ncbi:MAG: hypothetical protein AAFU85_17335 [Planctomycetota bacterium]
MRFSGLTFALCLTLVWSRSGAADFVVVGVYDENDVQTNSVNTSATSLTVGQMTGDVAGAFASGTGGVIDFDSGTLEREGQILARFGGGARAVTFENSFDDWGIGSLGAGPLAGPISGARVLFDGAGSGTPFMNSIEIGQVTDSNGNPLNEGVSAFGMTIIDLFANSNDIEFTITFSDNSTELLNHTIPSGSNVNDTFFGFEAASGTHITRIDYTATRNLASDDWAFLTSSVTAIPEPGFGIACLLLTAGIYAGRQRRRPTSSFLD